MSNGDREMVERIKTKLQDYQARTGNIPGVNSQDYIDCLALQLRDSIHRVKYATLLSTATLSEHRCDPTDVNMFHPLKAAVFYHQKGFTEEAYWLLYLFVHFGKSRSAGWRYAREVYGGDGEIWTWDRVRTNTEGFRTWLDVYSETVRSSGGVRGFGNHRKFESLAGTTVNGTGASVQSYVNWVARNNSHQELFEGTLQASMGDPRKAFHTLYLSMRDVYRFGRLARFDYLCMVGKLSFSQIAPDLTYWNESTGPMTGIRMLFGDQLPKTQIDESLWEIATEIDLGPFAMQILEDAICNWQKCPGTYSRFIG